MKLIAVFAVFAAMAFGQSAELKQAQQETRIARLETLDLKEQIAVDAYNKIHAEKLALYAETCKTAGVDPANCAIDPVAKTVTSKAAPAAKDK